ncbi:SIMPL domain-containing protein [Limimaricola pyoseonensis]|uniref:SIMPL domain-containing protein n=1 Tax=Limimaricola pyoseonensis TaxID=521013 RepID=A0A1G7CX71_9RHOB|nr:SIMPL domain-containing protein [Limimaricola pyoseonensis]SDE44054.1 hypothetical protein SAMN04488567_1687 [Limimaricola pyoseonensis]
MKFTRMPAFALAALLAQPLAAQQAADPAGPVQTVQRSLTVSGEGRVAAAPDLAHVSIGVSESAETARAALDAMNAAMAKVLERLTAAGVPEEDIRTGQLTLDRDYARRTDGAPEPQGFVATTLVEVETADLDGLGMLLDAAVGEGANRLHGLRFELADPAAARDEARRKAVADAQARAALYAEAAGVELAELTSLSENGFGGGPQPMMEMRMAADAGVPVAPGQVEITANVTMVYAIE